MGARPGMDGLSGIHTHMTNSMNTPVEAFEQDYPVRVLRYRLRKDSGGSGKSRGGDGVVREIQFLTRAQLTLLSDRRKMSPYGLHGGSPGQAGRNRLLRRGSTTELASKCTVWVEAGDVVCIETPGGGGCGSPA
jgi:N-methylhydantoinase B